MSNDDALLDSLCGDLLAELSDKAILVVRNDRAHTVVASSPRSGACALNETGFACGCRLSYCLSLSVFCGVVCSLSRSHRGFALIVIALPAKSTA